MPLRYLRRKATEYARRKAADILPVEQIIGYVDRKSVELATEIMAGGPPADVDDCARRLRRAVRRLIT